MNLLDRLREQIKDDRDIEAVLFSASGSSGYSGLPNGWVEIYSDAANSKPYVSLKFRSGRITQLKIGQPLSSLTAQDALVDRALNAGVCLARCVQNIGLKTTKKPRQSWPNRSKRKK